METSNRNPESPIFDLAVFKHFCEVMKKYDDGGANSIRERHLSLKLSCGLPVSIIDQATQLYHKDYNNLILDDVGSHSERAKGLEPALGHRHDTEEVLFSISRADYFIDKAESFFSITIGNSSLSGKSFIVGRPYFSAGNGFMDLAKQFEVGPVHPDKVGIYSFNTNLEVTDVSTEPELQEVITLINNMTVEN